MKYFSAEYFENLWVIASQYVMNNYDYCFLTSMHTKNRIIGTKNIIAGMSYTRNGIIETNLADTINFSSASQDLYFDFEHIKKAVEEGKQRIETCIINFGYYALYWDLSFSKNESRKIKKTQYPIFGKAHHLQITEELDMMQEVVYDRKMFAGDWVREFVSEWAIGFFMEESAYYGRLKTREDDALFGLGKRPWNTLPEDTKNAIANQVANDHNHFKVYEHTKKENENLIREIAEYLIQHQITPVFLILPFTTYYNDYIDTQYKEDIVSLLEELPYQVEFLDMNDYLDMFDDSDFLDSEHLNLQGALKATELLKAYLQLI